MVATTQNPRFYLSRKILGGTAKVSVFCCPHTVGLTPIQSGIAKGSLTLPTTSYCMGSERGYLGLI